MKSIVIAMMFVLLSKNILYAQLFSRNIDGRKLEFEEVWYEDFGESLDDWLPEGRADIERIRGRLQVDARNGMVTIWCKKEFNGPQLVEYDVRLMSASIESNINMFLLAGKPDAKGILATTDERNGVYNQYHHFPNYLITILNGISPGKREQLRIRMRLNPGFELVEEQWHEPLVFGKVYHVSYLIEPPRVTVLLDEQVVCRVVYDKKLLSGLHGLRIWQTFSMYDNFRVSRLVNGE